MGMKKTIQMYGWTTVLAASLSVSFPAQAMPLCEDAVSCQPAIAKQQGFISGYSSWLQTEYEMTDEAFVLALEALSKSLRLLSNQLTAAKATSANHERMNTDSINEGKLAAAEIEDDFESMVQNQPPVDMCVAMTANRDQMSADHVAAAHVQALEDRALRRTVQVATVKGAAAENLQQAVLWEEKYGPNAADPKMRLLDTSYGKIFGAEAHDALLADAGEVFTERLVGGNVDVPKGDQLTNEEGLLRYQLAMKEITFKALARAPFQQELGDKASYKWGGGPGATSASAEQMRKAAAMVHDLDAMGRSAAEDQAALLKLLVGVKMPQVNHALNRLLSAMETSNHLASATLLENIQAYGETKINTYPAPREIIASR